MNRDGSFRLARGGLHWADFLHPYHRLLTISWTSFFLWVLAAYVVANLAFALAYLACGSGALSGVEDASFRGRFLAAFFFSVQTLATIGYGKMTPEGLAANTLVAFEALFGLMGFAFATGLLFARFSRPSARVVFSSVAVMAPYRGGRGLMFRIANGRPSELIDVRATVTLARFEPNADGRMTRRFHSLALERSQAMFLALQWVIVHPVDEASPLHGLSEADIRASQPELLALITGVDETFSQTVFARSSYAEAEIVWGARFRDIHETDGKGGVFLNVRRLGEIEAAVLPE